MCLSNSHKV